MQNAIDGRNVGADPIRLSKSSPVLIDTNLIQLGGKSSDFNASAESFLHAVRVLMMGYALLSARDPTGGEWCNLDAASLRIADDEQHSRRNSHHQHVLRSKILECEMAIRTERPRICLADPEMLLTDIIVLAPRRHNIWPLASDFRGLGRPANTPSHAQQGRKAKGLVRSLFRFWFLLPSFFRPPPPL